MITPGNHLNGDTYFGDGRYNNSWRVRCIQLQTTIAKNKINHYEVLAMDCPN